MQGGALFEFDGNFVGMNLFSNMERPIFLQRDIIFDRLNHLQTSMEKIIFPVMVKSIRCANIFLVCLSMSVVAAFSTLNNNLMLWY
jgi:hypothetical protein